MDKQKQRMDKAINAGKISIWLVLLVLFIFSFQTIVDLEDFGNPHRRETFIRILTELLNPNITDSQNNYQTVMKMWETIQIAFLATTIGAVLAIPFSFFRARPSSYLWRGFNILFETVLAAVRAVHAVITVIFAVILFGIGPTAGVLAITLFSTAVLFAKYSDYAVENQNLKWPILLKVHFPGIAFKHFPVNLLIATIIGFMGGGGIGFILQQNLYLLNYRDAGVSLLAIIITISSIDLISRAVWHKIQRTRISASENEEILSRI